MSQVKVKMLTGISGLANPDYDLPEHSYAPEEIVMLHPKLASAWIDGGIAQAVRDKVSPVAEQAAADSPAPVEEPAPKAAAKTRKNN